MVGNWVLHRADRREDGNPADSVLRDQPRQRDGVTPQRGAERRERPLRGEAEK